MQCNLRVEYVRSLGGANDMQPLLGLNGGGQSPTVGADYDAGKDYNEMGETKVCTKADCRHKGEPQPLEEFYKGASQCKDCFRAYDKKKRPIKITADLVKKPDAGRFIITIDLSETPELYHKLAEREAVDIIMNALREE